MVDTLLVYQNGDTKHIGLAQPLPPVLRLPDYWPGARYTTWIHYRHRGKASRSYGFNLSREPSASCRYRRATGAQRV